MRQNTHLDDGSTGVDEEGATSGEDDGDESMSEDEPSDSDVEMTGC